MEDGANGTHMVVIAVGGSGLMQLFELRQTPSTMRMLIGSVPDGVADHTKISPELFGRGKASPASALSGRAHPPSAPLAPTIGAATRKLLPPAG